jgi:hypothetical protein
MNFTELYIKGMLTQQEKKQKEDMKSEKRYRGGNAGVLIDGLPANSCARKVIARAEGRYEEVAWNKQLMFDLGELNEDRWHSKLEAAGLKVKSADGLVQAKTSQDFPVTGSPDTIVVDEGKDSYLIEHKHISSFWTFRDIVLEGNPKLENIAQAALYAMNLDLPFCLLYTASVNFSGPSFLTKMVPHPTEAGSENFEYTYYKYNHNKLYKGKPTKSKLKVPGQLLGAYPADLYKSLDADLAEFKNTIPTIKQFDLRFDSTGVVEYSVHGSGQWKPSVATKDNIMEFYSHIREKELDKELPERPINLSVKGESKGFNSCDYCSLSEVCDKYEGSFEEWLKQAKMVTW